MKYYRKKLARYPVFEWVEVGILLCIAGGFLDAYTYVTRGGVFCNAQTSNLIFLTLNLASGNRRRLRCATSPPFFCSSRACF